jgi:RNA polymerase sigma factor (sigma-70 family)
VEQSQEIAAVWRIESAKVIAGVARMVRDVGLAEDLAQEALVAALETWPQSGLPDNPGAWLMAAARNKALDHFRRQKMLDEKHNEIALEQEGFTLPADEEIADDMLRLVFTACHPVLATEARTALTLKLLGGLTTDEIARAFLVSEPTIAQRIVRAKRTLAEARVPFEVPGAGERAERLGSVLEVIYLVFNEGYAATVGADWMRPALCDEALRLGRILAGMLPHEPEVHGLVALMELQASRFKARLDASGAPVLLMDQDRSRWDRLLIRRGLAALQKVEAMGRTLGPYALQAAIAACHARALEAKDTDWPRIVALYDALAELTGSPVVEVNRAVAVGMAFGPAAGLEIIDEVDLKDYYLLHAVRGDLLAKLGRLDEARAEFQRAATLTRNEAERKVLKRRAAIKGV